MKNISLFAVFISVFSAPSLVAQNDQFRSYKEQILKNKVYEQLSRFLIFNDEKSQPKVQYVSLIQKMNLLDVCIGSHLSGSGISACTDIKDQLLTMSDSYLPSEDSKLKRILENPEDLDILNFNSRFTPEERTAVDHMADVIDKNIQRAEIQHALEAENPVVKNKVTDELSYRYIVNGWWSYMISSSVDIQTSKAKFSLCQNGWSESDKYSLNKCSQIKDFIQNYIPTLKSDDEQRIAKKMVDKIDANRVYNQAKTNYEGSLKDLYGKK